MSNPQGRSSPDGYRLAEGAPCFADDNSVNKRANFIIAHLKDTSDQSILDIGCGTGAYLQLLSTYSSILIGIDTNEMNLKEATRNRSANLMLMSAQDLAFQDNFFDVVVMVEVLEHILDDQKAQGEISRVLKPGGKLIMTVPNKWFPFETHGLKLGQFQLKFPLTFLLPFSPAYPIMLRRLIANARVYSYSYLKEMLNRNGFSIREKRFLMPSLDTILTRFGLIPKCASKIFQRFFNLLEDSPFNIFGTTIIIIADKSLE